MRSRLVAEAETLRRTPEDIIPLVSFMSLHSQPASGPVSSSSSSSDDSDILPQGC